MSFLYYYLKMIIINVKIMLNFDCIQNILIQFIKICSGLDYKNIIIVCKDFYDFYKLDHITYVRKFSNHLLTLLKLFPDKDWDWGGISHNPNITWDVIQDNPDKEWDWNGISCNT